MKSLSHILDLEDKHEFKEALDLYGNLYASDLNDFEVWKHFYFLVWTAVEDAPGVFESEEVRLRLLNELFKQGIQLFSNLADFSFIAGYTISISPYEYGEYEAFEQLGQNMLKRAMEIDSNDAIYRVTYYGSIAGFDDRLYRKELIEAGPEVLKKFGGKGILNRYFRNALYREGDQACR